MVFQSACSRRISAAALSHSRELASSSARAHSASLRARLADQVSLRSARSALRRVKKRSQASRNCFHVALRLLARHRADLLPLGLQLLQLVGRLDPVGGVRELLGARDERQLLLEIALALLVAVREELAQPRLDRIGGLAVAMPQGLRLGTRRLGHALPPLLDVVELARRLVEVFFLGTLGRVEAEPGAQRLGPGDQLLLHRGVGEAFPLVHLAQLVHARRDDGGGGLEPLEQRRLLFLLDRRRRVDGAAKIARQPFGLAQREIFGGAALLRALDQLLDALQLLAQRPLLGRVLLFVALRDARHGLLVALRDRLVQALRARHERGPFGGRRGPRLARQRLFAAQALRLARELREAGVRLLHVELVLMALPRGGHGRLELRAAARRPRRRLPRRRALPIRGSPVRSVRGASSPRMLSTCWIIAARLACSAARRSSSARRSASMRSCSAMPLRALPAAASKRATLSASSSNAGSVASAAHSPSVRSSSCAAPSAAGDNRFDAGHQARHPLLPRFECDPPCGFAPRPVLASLPAPSLTPTCSSPVPPPDRAFREARPLRSTRPRAPAPRHRRPCDPFSPRRSAARPDRRFAAPLRAPCPDARPCARRCSAP